VAAGVALEPGQRGRYFLGLAPKLADPSVVGIIFATPVYFGNMSSLCKAFLGTLHRFHKDKTLANKVGGVLAVGGGRNGGVELTIRSVQPRSMAPANDRRRRRAAHGPLGRNGLGRQTPPSRAGLRPTLRATNWASPP